MNQEPESLQNQPLSELERRRIESEIAKNEAERAKLTLEAEEVRKRVNQKWFLHKVVLGSIVVSALLVNWLIFYFAPMLQTKQINAELDNAKLAQENKKTGDSLAVARANLARAAEVNEIQRRENEKRVNQIAQENAVLRERQAEAEAKATKLQAGFQSLRNSYDSLANEQKLTTNERAKYKALAEAAQMQADSEKIVIEHLRRDKDELDRTAQKIANLEVPELQTIYFDWQSYDLSSNARASLDKNLKILQDFPNITIQIVGSGDGVIWNRELEMEGTADDIAREDSVLGAKRARRAEEYLVGRGISTYRIRIIAYHGDYLGHSYHGQETHGRCEFVIIKQ